MGGGGEQQQPKEGQKKDEEVGPSKSSRPGAPGFAKEPPSIHTHVAHCYQLLAIRGVSSDIAS